MPVLKIILRWIESNWKELRYFAFYNGTIFEIFFLLLYTFEQVLLIYVLSLGIWSPLNIAGYFAIAVLFTFALQKIVMQSRIRLLEDKVSRLKTDNDTLQTALEGVMQEFERRK